MNDTIVRVDGDRCPSKREQPASSVAINVSLKEEEKKKKRKKIRMSEEDSVITILHC